jgi:hypothetical protein
VCSPFSTIEPLDEQAVLGAADENRGTITVTT